MPQHIHKHKYMEIPNNISNDQLREALKTEGIYYPKKRPISQNLEKQILRLIAIDRLMPRAAWNNYKLLGLKDLTEVLLKNSIVKTIRLAIKGERDAETFNQGSEEVSKRLRSKKGRSEGENNS